MTVDLASLASRYALLRGLLPGTSLQMQWTVRAFEKFLCRLPTVSDLSDEKIAEFVAWQRKNGYSPYTIRRRTVELRAVWRDAHERGLIDRHPGRMPRVRIPLAPPVAWLLDEMRRLLAAASGLRGEYKTTRLARATYWRVLVLIAWDTGLRRCDLLSLRRDQIDARGLVVMSQQKTGQQHVARVRQETRQAIAQLGPWPAARGEIILWWTYSREHWDAELRRIVAAAGLSRANGLTRRLRRSSASHVERIAPGAGSRHLGHSDGGALAARHYLDPRIVRAEPVLPPRLTG